MTRKEILGMRAVAKDIIFFNQKRKDLTHKQVMDAFYKIMRKHGIKQGEWDKDGSGRIMANFEWSMCLTLIMDTHNANNSCERLFNDKTPSDLEAYGKRPTKKK